MANKIGGHYQTISLKAFAMSAVLLSTMSCIRADRMQVISGPVSIGSQWVEIRPSKPLRVEREHNSLELELARNYAPDYQANGYRFPDGSLVTPEVRLVDQDGNEYPLRVGSLSNIAIGYRSGPLGSREDLPNDKLFTLVRVRSNGQIDCSRIVWRSYNQKDHL
jgi:hypothetical protein